MSRSSERSSRVDHRRDAARAAPRSLPKPRSQPLTSKPSPVRATNRSSRLGVSRPRTPARRTPAWTSAATIFSGSQVTGYAVHLTGAPGHLLDAELVEHARGGLGLARSARARVAGPAPRTSATVPCATRRPSRMTPEVGADLLDLGEQVAGDEHRGAVGGQRPDQRAHLAGALRVEAVGRLVEDEQVAGCEQRRGDGEPLPHAERVGAVALPGRGQQAHPVERRVDAPARGARVGQQVGGVEPGQVGPAREVGVERRALDERADPGQGVARPPCGMGMPEQAAACPPWARPGRAASGSSWSCPSRWGRGSRRPRPGERACRCRRRPPAGRTAWSGRPSRPRRAAITPRGVDRGQRRRAHRAARAAYSLSGATAPTANRPSSVSTAENSVPPSTRPLPHEPETFGRACRSPAACSDRLPADRGVGRWRVPTATAPQPVPTTLGLAGWAASAWTRSCHRPVAPGRLGDLRPGRRVEGELTGVGPAKSMLREARPRRRGWPAWSSRPAPAAGCASRRRRRSAPTPPGRPLSRGVSTSS